MKKTSFARRNALIPRGAQTAGVVVLFIALIILLVRFIVPGVISSALTPFSRASSLAASVLYNTSAVFTNPAALQKERDAARGDTTTLLNQNAVLAAKVQDLTRLLGTRTEPTSGILAGVLARPPESPYDVLIVDAGMRAGVAEGARVLGTGGIPIGTIASVTQSSARILLYSAPGVSTPAWVGTTRIPLALIGEGSGAFDATVSKEAGIAMGDAVLIAGEGALPFATVIRVDSDASSPSVTLRIQAIVNPFTLTWVTIAHSAL